MTRPAGISSSSIGAARMRSDFSDVITNSQSATAKPSARILSSQCRMSALTCGATPGRHPPGGLGVVARAARARTARRAGARSASRSSGVSMWPSTASEMRPLSSETTSTTASVSSARPRRGPVTRAHGPAELGIARQRQEAARRRHAIVADEHRAVVERRVGQEQALEEVGSTRCASSCTPSSA